MKFVCLLLAAASLVSAHFTLDYPPTTGFDEDQEVNAPCGGFPPDASNLTAWPLSGGEISVDLHHPYALFLFRAQLMGSDTWFNLSNGMVYMSGLGEGCIHALPVPSSWSGQAGVIQVVGQPPDAILYQCAGVIFTAGAAGTSNVCKNGTGITLNDTTQQFPISNLSVNFVGSTSTPSPSASSMGSAKSGAGIIRFEYGIAVLGIALSLGGLVLAM